MENYCRHQWQERTAVLSEVLHSENRENSPKYFVCQTCLLIREEKDVLEKKKEGDYR